MRIPCKFPPHADGPSVSGGGRLRAASAGVRHFGIFINPLRRIPQKKKAGKTDRSPRRSAFKFSRFFSFVTADRVEQADGEDQDPHHQEDPEHSFPQIGQRIQKGLRMKFHDTLKLNQYLNLSMVNF